MVKLSSGMCEGLRKISPSEKTEIHAELGRIEEEYIILVEAAQLDGISNTTEYSNYINVYKNLCHYLMSDPGLLLGMDTISYVDPVEYQNVFNAYYSGKSKLSCFIVIPPTNQIHDVSLAWSNDENKGILIKIEFEYVQGIVPATHFILFQTVDTVIPPVIDPDVASLTRTVKAVPELHRYKIEFTVPQISVTTQLHYRLALSAASLGAVGFRLAGALVDGGESWRDITVVQEPQLPDVTTMPINADYIQFRGQDTPENIWGGTWENISGLFAGEYIRVEGGDALPFGEIQQEGLPNITGYDWVLTHVTKTEVAEGALSIDWKTAYGDNPTGNPPSGNRIAKQIVDASKSSSIYGKSKHITPYGSAIRIWRRVE